MKNEGISKTLLVTSVIINIILLITLFNVNNEVSNLNSNVINLQNNINNIEYKVNNLEYSLREENSFVLNTELKVDVGTISTEGCKVKANVSFKDLSQEEKPYILYRQFYNIKNNIQVKDDNWIEVELDKVATLAYEANLDIKYGYNYEYKIITKGTNEKSSEIQILESKLYQPVYMDPNQYYSDNKVRGIIINVIKRYDVQGFDIDTITLKIDGNENVYTAEQVDKVEYYGEKEYYLKGEENIEVKQYKIEVPIKELDANSRTYTFLEMRCKNGFNIVERSIGL